LLRRKRSAHLYGRIGKLNEASNKKFDNDFIKLEPSEKHELLVEIDKEAKEHQDSKKKEDPQHYFIMMKQLTLWGYFTSEVGSKKALRWLPVPGKYEGCIPYTKGDKAWHRFENKYSTEDLSSFRSRQTY
jgi:hypothetical protein